ncbi:MAG TPA: TetR/AcrR family transcriptional regulator [Aeromicrobium sp.]|nr:TetR/AcrR family transcriptional regulator [Aeromicrobium sp.]HKY57600.1 TetR/AcrR family transcriptional regulator [Aeromicrobium sp.]
MAQSNAGTKGVPRFERESQILTVASEVFATEGFATTNIQAIAEGAGISKPLIYNYFGSKEGLFLACLERAGEIVAGEIERIANEDSVGIERGMRTLDGMFHVLEDQRHLWRLFYDRTAPTTGPVAAAVNHYTERITKLADEGVAELMALSGVTDRLDVSAMTAVWMGIVDSLMRWWVEHPDESAAAMTERSGRLLAAILGGVQ